MMRETLAAAERLAADGHRGRGDRRRHAGAARCGDDPGVGRQDRPLRDLPRGAADRRFRRARSPRSVAGPGAPLAAGADRARRPATTPSCRCRAWSSTIFPSADRIVAAVRRPCATADGSLHAAEPNGSSLCRISAKACRKPRSSPGMWPRAIMWSRTSRWSRWRPTRRWSRFLRREPGASPGCLARPATRGCRSARRWWHSTKAPCRHRNRGRRAGGRVPPVPRHQAPRETGAAPAAAPAVRALAPRARRRSRCGDRQRPRRAKSRAPMSSAPRSRASSRRGEPLRGVRRAMALRMAERRPAVVPATCDRRGRCRGLAPRKCVSRRG